MVALKLFAALPLAAAGSSVATWLSAGSRASSPRAAEPNALSVSTLLNWHAALSSAWS